MKIATIVGARPQFIKLALLSRQIRKKHKEILIHTGQHYDNELSDIFFKELCLPSPDYNLNVISDKQGEQVSLMLKGIERILLRVRPDLVIVYGDTNSTLAGALAAAKLNIPLAHVEAGLRSFRKDMPEEINRVLTDHMSTFLFCPTKNAMANLKREGISKYIFCVGDVMYDNVHYYLPLARRKSTILTKLRLRPKNYYLLTIHRAENTEDLRSLKRVLTCIDNFDKVTIFPIHPRTRKFLGNSFKPKRNLYLILPVSYLDMLILEENARTIFTDSGGVQKEAYFLNVPCLTLRKETEWVETVKTGGNKVVGLNREEILKEISRINDKKLRNKSGVFGWGNATEKIVRILEEKIGRRR